MATTSNNDRSNVIRSWQLYSDSRADKARTKEKKEKWVSTVQTGRDKVVGARSLRARSRTIVVGATRKSLKSNNFLPRLHIVASLLKTLPRNSARASGMQVL